MEFNKILGGKTIQALIIIIAVLIVILLVFAAGMFVGYQKADFSYRWGENYHRNFAGPRDGFMREVGGNDLIGSHGTFGQVLKVESSTLVVKGDGDVEKVILVDANTIIERLRDQIKIADLKVGDNVVIIGQPDNSGQIAAKLIRVMPAPNGLMPPASGGGNRNQPPFPPNNAPATNSATSAIPITK